MAKTRTNNAPNGLTDAEWDILRVLWQRAGPAAAGDVQEALQSTRDWAYPTVKTLMDRMLAKGLLTLQRIRNLQLYTPAITEQQARRSELRRLLARAFGGALSPLMQFLGEEEQLDPADIAALRQLIARAERKSTRKK